jgi:hypothetical protein
LRSLLLRSLLLRSLLLRSLLLRSLLLRAPLGAFAVAADRLSHVGVQALVVRIHEAKFALAADGPATSAAEKPEEGLEPTAC